MLTFRDREYVEIRTEDLGWIWGSYLGYSADTGRYYFAIFNERLYDMDVAEVTEKDIRGA